MMHTIMAATTPSRDPGSERTTVTLPTELARRLRTEARAHDRSVSAIVREALEAYLAGQPAPELPSFAGVGASGMGDLSERVEELLARAARRRATS
jgi:plasmid stability protein